MSLKNNALIIVAAAVAMSAGFWLSTMQQKNTDTEDAIAQARKNFSPIQGVMINPPRKIVVPALLKDNAETFTQDDLSGHWSLLYFGYTHCPDICPVTLGVVAQAKKSAAAIKHMFPDVFFISVDPDRDELEMLAEYVQYFDKDFVGVTGDKKLLQALAIQLSAVYMKMPSEKSETTLSKQADYDVDHSSALLLLNPQAKLVAFLNPPHDAKTILKDFQMVVDSSN